MVLKIIAIDGPAAAGKGTIARRLAETLDFAYMDTGALYRLAALELLKAGGDPNNERQAVEAAIHLKRTYWSGMSNNPELRRAAVGDAASTLAPFRLLRQVLHNLQVDFAHNPPAQKQGAVLDGRDIGTVICPKADIKFFITASTEIRARRRTKELLEKGHKVTYEDILAEMKIRDERDATRIEAPLKPASDAIIIDTSDLSADEAFEEVMSHTQTKIS